MKLSPNGVLFVASFEGFRADPYQDSGGVWTIGYGHTHDVNATTKPVSRVTALTLLRADAQIAADAVNRTVKVALTQAQFDALVSFTYNCGAGAIAGSVGRAVNAKPHVWNLLKMRAWHEAVTMALLQWDHVDGKVLAGLYRRRLDEAHLFTTGKYVI